MADQQQDGAERQPEKLPEPSLPPVDNNINKIKEEYNQTIKKPENDKANCNTPKPFIVKIDKGKGWSKAEIISLFGILISGSLFFMTLRAFKKTSKAVEISEESLKDSRRKDSIAAISSVKRDFLDSIRREQDYTRDTIARRQAQQSLQAQINSIQEAQKEFEIDNMPYLECQNFTFRQFEAGKPPVIECQIINLGNHTAKILSGRLGHYYNTYTLDDPFKQLAQYKFMINVYPTYVGRGYPELHHYYANRPISFEDFNKIKMGVFKITFYGEITYISEATEKKRICYFVVELFPPSNNQPQDSRWKVIKLENKDVK